MADHAEKSNLGAGRRNGALQATGVVLLVGAAAILVGWPSLRFGFTSGDDQRFITEHRLVAQPTLGHAIEMTRIIHGDLYQPIPMLTFQANYAAADRLPNDRFGVSAFGFHLTNVVLHALNSVLAMLLASRVSRRTGVGLLTGLFFACHPFGTEPVSWVSGRMILLGSFFALGAILVCLSRPDAAEEEPLDETGRPTARTSLTALLLYAFSLLSKVMPTVPFAAMWLERRCNGENPWTSRRRWTFLLMVLMAVAATWSAAYTTSRAGFVVDQSEFNTSAPAQALLSFRYYLEHYLVPLGLAPWVPPAEGIGLLSRDCAIAMIELIALVSLAFVARKRLPTVTAGLILFLILLAPFMATASARRFLAADRYMYLPIAGLHLALSASLIALSDKLDGLLRPSFRHRFLLLPTAAICIVWIYYSWGQSLTWQDTISRDARTVAVYPDSVDAHYELAKACNFSGDPAKALDVVDRARARWPDNPRLASQAGEAYRREGDWRLAEIELRKAAAALPNHTNTQYQFALVLEQLEKTSEADWRIRKLLKTNPGFLPGWTTLGRLRAAAGNPEGAMEAYRRALEINPMHRTATLALARLLLAAGHAPDAGQLLTQLLNHDPDDSEAKFQLAVLLATNGHGDAAIHLYDDLLSHDESNIVIRLNRGATRLSVGDLAGAESDYRHVAESHPEVIDAYLGLQDILVRKGQAEGVVRLWQEREDKMGPSGETTACKVWALSMTGRLAEAEKQIADIPADSAERRFSNWAIALAAVRQRDESTARDYLWKKLAASRDAALRSWQLRLVRRALDELPQDLKQSPGGNFALAIHLADAGLNQQSEMLLKRIAEDSPPWSAAANALLNPTTAPAE